MGAFTEWLIKCFGIEKYLQFYQYVDVKLGMVEVYQKTPELRIDRLDEITAVCDRPLVLHGGSGTPDDQMQNAIHHGITKINIYSDV